MPEEKEATEAQGAQGSSAGPQPPDLNQGAGEVKKADRPNPLLKALRENPRLRNLTAYGVMILLLLFTIWTGGLRAAGARDAAQLVGVDALAASLSSVALERDPIKAERALAKIVRESGYRSLTLTDPRGVVTASTDSSRKGERILDLERAPDKARKYGTEAGPVIRRKVFLAEDNAIGSLEVGLNPE
jgi:hypothetical protein